MDKHCHICSAYITEDFIAHAKKRKVIQGLCETCASEKLLCLIAKETGAEPAEVEAMIERIFGQEIVN